MYKKLKGRESLSLEDLREAHPELYKGLTALLEYDEPATATGDNSSSASSTSSGGGTPGSVEEVFGLTFEVAHEAYGAVHSVELCPGGANMPVTSANRQQYVELYVKYLLDTSIRMQFEAFARGFHKVRYILLKTGFLLPIHIMLIIASSLLLHILIPISISIGVWRSGSGPV